MPSTLNRRYRRFSVIALPPNRDSAGTACYRITNGFPIGSLDMFIQMVLGRV